MMIYRQKDSPEDYPVLLAPEEFQVRILWNTKAKIPLRGKGYMLDFTDPQARYTFLNAKEEGVVFYYEDGVLQQELVVKIITVQEPDLNSPLEEWSLDFCESDSWLCDRAFELFNRSAWGELVAMGLLGRNAPITLEQKEALQVFLKTGVLAFPEARERMWYRGLSEEHKDWVKSELRNRIVNYSIDLGACDSDAEDLAIERDNIQSVLWLVDHEEDLCDLDERASRLLDVSTCKHEQLYRAGIDYPEAWWSIGYDEDEDYE